ncbi:hypothetical protein VKT23_013627 [Stygiomarasmius scandens]|uniref:Uncharacterized protein n=1 Tax=Marasmiellus scandens TaxID=2682957 RepID=A0ABR1J3G7_9AGAR
MPRPKLYKNKQQQQLANCTNSNKHYEKNKDIINAKRRQKHQAKCKAAAEAEAVERKRKRENYWKQEGLKHKESGSSKSCPLAGIRNIQCLLNKTTNYQPSSFLEQICLEYQEWLKADQMAITSPIRNGIKIFESLFESSKPFTHTILQQHGCGSEYSEATRIQTRISKMVLCLEDMEIAQIEGRLGLMYKLQRLLYQDAAMVHYIDG